MRAVSRLLVTTLTLFFLTGCKEYFTDHTIKDQGFIYCGGQPPENFDPQQANSGLLLDSLSSQLFDRLIQLDGATFEPRPMLAQSWEVSHDQRQYTFHLRKDVYFQKNKLFTPQNALRAQDVVFSFSRVMNKKKNLHTAFPLFDSLNFAALLDRVEAVTPHTVRFTLTQPNASFLSILASQFAVIHSAEYAQFLQKTGQMEKFSAHPIGTGAYQLEKYQPDQFIKLTRNPYYWNGQAKMLHITYDISKNGVGDLAKLFTGECDVLASPKQSQFAAITQGLPAKLHSKPGMNLVYLALNTQSPKLANPRVRKAINMALNKKALVNGIYYGMGSIASSVLPPFSWAYSSNSASLYRPDKAKKLLARANFDHFTPLTLLVPLTVKPYNPSPLKMAELLQVSLAKVGIKVAIEVEENFTAALNKMKTKQHDMILTGWISDNGDPDSMLRSILSCSAITHGYNMANFCDENFEHLLDQAIAISRISERKALYATLQQILNEKMPIVPLVHSAQNRVISNSLHGLEFTSFSDESFATVIRGH
ncbi:MAG: ABC transporter substrate-binding protein [Vibrionaceae bacterium]